MPTTSADPSASYSAFFCFRLHFLAIVWATPSAAGPRPLLIVLALQIPGSVASGSWHFWYTSLSFRMIGSVTLLSWGILGFFRDARKHNNGHLEVQPGFLPRCGGFC